MKSLHSSQPFHPPVSVSHERQRPCSPNDSFSFLTFFFPTGQSLFPYTHCLFPSPLSAQLCLPEMPLITVFCFLKQTLRPGQCWAAHFSAGLITVPSARASGADQRPPGLTGDNRLAHLNHDRVHVIVLQSHEQTLHTHICKRAEWVGSHQNAKLHDKLSWIWIHLGLQGAGSQKNTTFCLICVASQACCSCVCKCVCACVCTCV